MSVIKSRGKRVDNGEWVYGYPCITCTGKGFILTGEDECLEKSIDAQHGENFITQYFFPVRRETMGQHTGFPDKSGKDIFDGDKGIVYTKGDSERHAYHVIVCMVNGCWCVVPENPDNSFPFRNELYLWAISFAITSTIHD